MNSIKRAAEGDANSAKGKKLATDENQPDVAAAVSKDNDAAVEELEQDCPLTWEKSLEEDVEEFASLTLAPEVEGSDYASMLEKASQFLDPDEKASILQIDAEDDELDADAARAELEKTGNLGDVFEFTNKESDEECKHWIIKCNKKEKLSEDAAKKTLEGLLDGTLCEYPESYDNFGKTPFGGSDEEEEDDQDDEEEESSQPLDDIKQAIATLLKTDCTVEHAWWSGHCEDHGGDGDTLIEREDYFFFETGSSKFVLKSEWQCRQG